MVLTRIEASTATESPARPVAVLDDADIAGRADGRQSSRSYRWLYLLGGLAAIAALAILLVPRIGNDSPAEGDASAADPDRVEDLVEGQIDLDAPDADAVAGQPAEGSSAEGGVEGGETEESSAADDPAADDVATTDEPEVDRPVGVSDPATDFGQADAVEVGDLTIANGRTILTDLTDWHASFASQRLVPVARDAQCRFASFAGAAAPAAYCGPVGEYIDEAPLYDVIPLQFDVAPDGMAVAQAVIAQVEPNQDLDPAIELVYPDGQGSDAMSDNDEDGEPASETGDSPSDTEGASSDDDAPRRGDRNGG